MKKNCMKFSENFMQKILKILEFGTKKSKFVQICVYEHQYPYDINLIKLPFQ
jgi:hypothetical protein